MKCAFLLFKVKQFLEINWISWVIQERILKRLCLFSVFYFGCFWFIPYIFKQSPAVNGDTHFLTLYFLKDIGFPSFHLQLWNPTVSGGEFLLVHYFPFPFLVMGVMSFFMSLGMAYNVGMILPILALPFCIYFCVKKMNLKSPAPLIASVFVLPCLYLESFTQMGVNAVGSVHGQFAHTYAICTLFLGLGFLYEGLNQNKISFIAICCFVATALSHAYVFVIIPFFFLSVLLLAENKTQFKSWLKILIFTGIYTILLSAWFLWPMIESRQWNTPRMGYAGYHSLIHIFSPILYPIYFLFVICLFFVCMSFIYRIIKEKIYKTPFTKHASRLSSISLWRLMSFYIIPALAYLGLFFIFPKIGLTDYRAIPQILLFTIIALSLFISFTFRKYFANAAFYVFLVLPLPIIMTWTFFHIKSLPQAVRNTYTNWEQEYRPGHLGRLIRYNVPRGLSKPRILCLTHLCSLLPYLNHRSTLPSTYFESTLLSPEVRYLNDYDWVARESCQVFSFYPYICPSNKLGSLEAKLKLMGVESIIINKTQKSEMSKTSNLVKIREYNIWTLYRFKNPPRLADPIYGTADIKPKTKDFRYIMNLWFDKYKGENYWQIIDLDQPSVTSFKKAIENNKQKDCDIDIQVDFFGLDFSTSCIGDPHILKFAYHSAIETSTKDPIYLMSPGMIGFVPSQEKIRFNFGQTLTWKLANMISITTALLMLLLATFLRKKSMSLILAKLKRT